MMRFAVSDPKFAKLVAQLAGVDNEPDIDRAFARAALSLVTEPGDRFAGALTRILTPEDLLEALIAKTSHQAMRAQLAQTEKLQEIENRFGNFADAFSDASQRWLPRLKLADVAAALETAARCKANMLLPESDFWPRQLDDLGEATPHCLWYRSKQSQRTLVSNCISIVGSRISTTYGEWVTSEIVADCAARELNIVSGGAYGIDSIAHRSAIANNQPTIAFMAGGIDRLYPSANASLFEKVIEQGVIFAEQAPGASPTKWRFLQRNRLIAAMSSTTIVVEAGLRSGALNTVTHALELDRSVGVVPGAITSQASAGCNRLISQGLVTSICAPGAAADLALGKSGWFQAEFEGLGAFETRALDAMSTRSLAESQIASKAGLTSRETSIALGQLSLLGMVKQTDTGWLKLPLEREQRPETSGQ
jgi:DNA processing protein